MDITRSSLRRRDWDTRPGARALQDCWAYGAIAARYGAQVERVEIRDGTSRGFGQVIRRSIGPLGIAYLPLGIRWTEDGEDGAALRALRSWLSRDRPHVLVAPSAGRPQRFSPRLSTQRQLCSLDLNANSLRDGLKKKWRNRLRVAERGSLEIQARSDVPDWLVRTERRQQRARGYGNLTRGWIEAWQRVAPGAALTLMAGPEDAPIAAMSFILHGFGATYLLGWTSPEGRLRAAHNLLMWRAMTTLADRGFRHLDLGQIDPKGLPGLARFKLGTGAGILVVPPVHALLPTPGPLFRGRPDQAAGAFPSER